MPKIHGPKGPAVPTRVGSTEKPAAPGATKPAAAEGWKAKTPSARAQVAGPAVPAAPPRASGTLHPRLSQLQSAANVFGADASPRATLTTSARHTLPAMFARGAVMTAPRAALTTEARLSAR